MNKEQFDLLCEQYKVKPDIALDLEGMCQALKDKNKEEVERILTLDV
jgi:hypothetical protein